MKVSLLLFVVFCAASCFASANCQSTFIAPGGAVTFCVTASGTIAVLDAGDTLIAGGEGYGICSASNQYYDLGSYGDSGNWNAPVITQPKGANTFPLTIVRTSTDGMVSLTQTYKFSNANKAVRVTMSFLGTFPQTYSIVRYAEFAGGAPFSDHTIREAFIWNHGGSGLTASPLLVAQVNGGILFGGNPGNICAAGGPQNLPYSGGAETLLTWLQVKGGKKKSLVFDYIPIW